MELIFLGTSAGVPTKERNVTSIVLALTGRRKSLWMFDCGEATQHQIMHTNIKIPKLETIFITHLHGDHIFGLPGLLCSRSMGGCEDPLTVYGPVGIKQFIETSLSLSASYLTFPLTIVEISQDGELFDDGQFKVSAYSLSHPVTCYGYRIEEAEKMGPLDAQRLKKEGVPAGPWMQTLKQGGTVTLDNGTVINGKDYLGAPIKGLTLAIFGDTAPCKNSYKLAQDADIIVHEATLDGSMQESANNYGHSSNIQTAKFAKNAGVKKLIATHFSGRYNQQDCERLLTECRNIFPNTEFAEDFRVFSLDNLDK